MAEYGAVFWMDASVRLLTNDFSSAYAQLRDNGGMMLFKQTKHSNFAATHRGTYDYIPTNRTRQMRTPMCIATAILAYNTKAMFYNVLWWFFLCALDRSCQAPMAKTMCDFDLDNKWATFADCHKWDQSTLNILLSNYYGYRHHKYLADDQLVAVERWPTHRYTIVMNDDRD
ncbi:hypothetical protein LSH36_874g01043 [Paralvinella palmiformis]|uniref:Uncharacterized protein n=1 Tax=Paralvinella palmiformis TaxID=53620 RepID=A0AAD9IYX2_9ANNE|nr:hypothetical protein LSH36_874g01043 [Paralvinella palmiformis]